jgi:signal recognition particle receptor subunit beta
LAVLDQADHAVVLGIVYDGPPEAGKTTSVRALARSFGREVYTPEEQEGRTVYFDWVEHTGGRFDGAPIRCQIMSVPGQECWAHRRSHMLERADAVIFVGDSSATGWPATLARLGDLRQRLSRREGPPVGVVLQANRRDACDAVALEELTRHARQEGVALVESMALDGTGVREAFVLAVRLALDRVREEQQRGTLPSRKVADQGAQLLEQLLALEPTAQGAAAAERLPGAEEPPCPPDHDPHRSVVDGLPSLEVPSGLIWPPVEGRILLRQALQAPARSSLDTDGHRLAILPGGQRASSPREGTFEDLEQGRKALLAWARLHSLAREVLSKGRCILLSPAPVGGYRLWQVVRAEPSLRELFVDGCDTMLPRHAARQLANAGRLLAEALAACATHGVALACTLDTVGVSELGTPIYVGDMPLVAAHGSAASMVQQVASELAGLLQHRSHADRVELCRELLSFQRREPVALQGAHLGELLSQLLTT